MVNHHMYYFLVQPLQTAVRIWRLNEVQYDSENLKSVHQGHLRIGCHRPEYRTQGIKKTKVIIESCFEFRGRYTEQTNESRPRQLDIGARLPRHIRQQYLKYSCHLAREPEAKEKLITHMAVDQRV